MSAKIGIVAVVCFSFGVAGAQSPAPAFVGAAVATGSISHHVSSANWGLITQGGSGVTDGRGDFRFFMAGLHAGKTLTRAFGEGAWGGSFEYAAELFPFWQSYTPVGRRQSCTAILGQAFPGSVQASCSVPFPVGGTYTGVSLTPIILRWNFAGSDRWAPWIQGAGGILWTNHKYPGFGGPPISTGGVTASTLGNNGAAADTSVWNFTPQFGIGVHYFTRSNRSVDFGANAVHISSASLGDRNPGVNASVQLTVGYSWWK